MLRLGSKEEIKEVLKCIIKYQIPLYIIGNGSNLLVKDGGIRGLVLKIECKKLEIEKKEENAIITVGSGVQLGFLAQKLCKEEISGFEFASGIPGTIGGAIYMNAGAHGGEMKDIILSTTYMDLDSNIHTIDNKEHEFDYRSSIFAKNKYIILETKLQLPYGKKEDIKAKMQEYASWRKEKQPLEYPSAGSTFKRGDGYITAKLIDDCNLKGYQIGGAQISEKHAGFIINKENATAKDIIELIHKTKEIVYEKTGKKIELEVKIIGEEVRKEI